jgi:acylphosphatase
VRGTVQGVFFRDSCRTEARRQRVAGWVRNRADGAVEAVFEGSDSAVEALVSWCRSGPPYASVKDIEVTKEEPKGLSAFRVLSLGDWTGDEAGRGDDR